MTNGSAISEENAKTILSYYKGLNKEEGLYDYEKLPFQALAEMQKKTTSVGLDRHGTYCRFRRARRLWLGSKLLKPFVKNTDLHYLMLQAAVVENKFYPLTVKIFAPMYQIFIPAIKSSGFELTERRILFLY